PVKGPLPTAKAGLPGFECHPNLGAIGMWNADHGTHSCLRQSLRGAEPSPAPALAHGETLERSYPHTVTRFHDAEDAAVAQVARKSRQFPFGSIPTCQPLRGADPQGGGIAAGSETGDLRRGQPLFVVDGAPCRKIDGEEAGA